MLLSDIRVFLGGSLLSGQIKRVKLSIRQFP
jgi:hypothetical protein